MPVYESVKTGKHKVMDEAQAAIYKDGVWRLVAEESPAEKARREAAEKKVDLDVPDDTTQGAPTVTAQNVPPTAAPAVVETTGKGKQNG